jgi:hypothetical protein
LPLAFQVERTDQVELVSVPVVKVPKNAT